MDASQLLNLLMAREQAGSTVLSDDLAIPHVVIEGADILKSPSPGAEGIRFSPKAPHVTTVFVLVSTMNLRNLHLQALSAIAQIVQTPGFEQNWMAARKRAGPGIWSSWVPANGSCNSPGAAVRAAAQPLKASLTGCVFTRNRVS